MIAGIKRYWYKFKDLVQRRRRLILTTVALLILLGAEIYWLKDNFVDFFESQMNCVSLGAILEIIALVVLWIVYPSFRKIFGEHKMPRRRPIHLYTILFLYLLFLLPFAILYLDSIQIRTDDISPLAQLSVIGISIGLAGILLAASRILNITPQKRLELICASQKFIIVAVLFIFFVAALYMVEKALNGINPNSFNIHNLKDLTNWYRGILFYLSIPSFYGSLFLFVLGLVDLVFAFFDLDTRPTIPR